MTEYARIESTIRRAPTSSLTDGVVQYCYFDPASPTKFLLSKISAATTGTTIELGNFSTIAALVIKNEDTTNFVEAKWRYTKATKTYGANKLGFTATAPCTITDADSTFLSALRVKAGDYVVVSNAAEAANSGTFLVQAAAAGTLTMIESTAFTLDAADAGTPTIISTPENEQRIPANTHIVAGYVRPETDLVLTANTGACSCIIYAIGT